MTQASFSMLLQVNELISRVHAEIPLQTIQVFLSIARRPGLSLSELGDMTGLAHASASAAVAALGKIHGLGRVGYDLVRTEMDPQDRRMKRMFLTEKGSHLAQQIHYVITTQAAKLI